MEPVELMVEFLPARMRAKARQVLASASDLQGQDKREVVRLLLTYASQQLEQHVARSHQGVHTLNDASWSAPGAEDDEADDDADAGVVVTGAQGSAGRGSIVPWRVILRLTDIGRTMRWIMAQSTLRDAAEEAGYSLLSAMGVEMSRAVPLGAQLWLRALRTLADVAGCDVHIPQLDGVGPGCSVQRPLAAPVDRSPLAAVLVSYKHREGGRESARRLLQAQQLMHYRVDLRPFEARVRLLDAGNVTISPADRASPAAQTPAEAATPRGALCEDPSADEGGDGRPYKLVAAEHEGEAAPCRSPPHPAAAAAAAAAHPQPKSPISYPSTPQSRALALARTGMHTDSVLSRVRDTLHRAVCDAYGPAVAAQVLPGSLEDSARRGLSPWSTAATVAAAAAAAASVPRPVPSSHSAALACPPGAGAAVPRAQCAGDRAAFAFPPSGAHPALSLSFCRRFVRRSPARGVRASPSWAAVAAAPSAQVARAQPRRTVAMLAPAPQGVAASALPVAPYSPLLEGRAPAKEVCGADGSSSSSGGVDEPASSAARAALAVARKIEEKEEEEEEGAAANAKPCGQLGLAGARLRRNAGEVSLSALRGRAPLSRTGTVGVDTAGMGTLSSSLGLSGSPSVTSCGSQSSLSALGLCLSPSTSTAGSSSGGGGTGSFGATTALTATAGAGGEKGPRFATAQCRPPLPRGHWVYFEFSVWPDDTAAAWGGAALAVGVAPAGSGWATMVGASWGSAALCSTGHAVTAGCWEGAPLATFGQSAGDIVGVAARADAYGRGAWVRFSVNGQPVARSGRAVPVRGGTRAVDTLAVAVSPSQPGTPGQGVDLVPTVSFERGAAAAVGACLAAHELTYSPSAVFGGTGGTGTASAEGKGDAVYRSLDGHAL